MSSFLPNGIIFSSPHLHCHLVLPTPLLRQSFSTQPRHVNELASFLAQHLISSFSFSPGRALKVSTYSQVAAIKPEDRAQSVIRFLKDTGLSDDQIKAVVLLRHRLLVADVDKILKPRVRELMHAGFSRELLVQLIRYCPSALLSKNTLSRLLFWRDFVRDDNEALSKIMQTNSLMVQYDICRYIIPRINLLKEYTLSNGEIVLLLRGGTRFMNKTLVCLRQTLELIEELGIPRGSTRFLSALKAIGAFTRETVESKVELFKETYGWMQDDVKSAFWKFLRVFTYSEDKVRSSMDFLIGNARFEPRSIASHPVMIGCSLESVLIARCIVLSALEDKGLRRSKSKCSLSTACKMSERYFYENYVVPFEKYLPGLSQDYFAASGGNVQV